jgi:hypothetical protein
VVTHRRRLGAVAAIVVLVVLESDVRAAAPRIDAARRGAEWIASQQQEDGGFFASGQRVDQTADALVSFVAGRGAGATAPRALENIRRNGADGATRGAYTGRIIAAIVAGGEDPRSFGGTDYVAKLTAQYDAQTGRYDSENLFSNLQGANGMLASGERLPGKAIDAIYANACSGGGFGYENGCANGADVDTTAWAINVLVAAGRRSDAEVASARAFLLSAQQQDGGFGFTRDKPTSADSTGLVLSAIDALREKAIATPWRQDDGDDPVQALLPLQDEDGSFRFVASSRKGNALSTINAVPGLGGVAYPINRINPSTSRPAPAANTSGREQDGGGTTAPMSSPSASPGASGSPSPTPAPIATDPTAPFAATTSEDGGGVPTAAVWGGLAGVAGVTGGTVWWLYRRSLRT